MFDFSQLGSVLTSLALWFAVMPTVVFLVIAGTAIFLFWRLVRAQERMASALELLVARFNRDVDKLD